MPTQKDFKRLVRARMQKTGESYTAARAALLAKASSPPSKSNVPKAVVPQARWAQLAGMSDAAVQAKTDRTWAQWVATLDAAEAWRWTHRDIAKHVGATYAEVSPWWAQTITVGYERIRGLRDVGQRRGGSYDANKSRTYPVDVSTLYRMFADARRRRRWLTEGFVKIRTSRVDTSMRVDWDDDTRVMLTFVAKGPNKSTVSIQHRGLADKAAATQAKAAWQGRLDTLRAML